jgi:hypothetical protein
MKSLKGFRNIYAKVNKVNHLTAEKFKYESNKHNNSDVIVSVKDEDETDLVVDASNMLDGESFTIHSAVRINVIIDGEVVYPQIGSAVYYKFDDIIYSTILPAREEEEEEEEEEE